MPARGWRDCVPHSVRHLTHWTIGTGDLYLVERALGHRQIAPTEVYARVSDEALRVAIARGRKISLPYRAGAPTWPVT
jgi:site-specific recombinase XerD